MCQASCKCVKPCVTCDCTQDDQRGVDPNRIKNYLLRYNVVQLDWR